MNVLNQSIGWLIVGGAVLWLTFALMVVAYGYQLGFPFFPLLVCVILFGPLGPQIVLLAVTIGAGPRRDRV